MRLIERCSEQGSESDKHRRGGTFGLRHCPAPKHLTAALWQFIRWSFTDCYCFPHTVWNWKKGLRSPLRLEIDCFNLEVNKHHACSQHPNPELLEIGTLRLPPTGKPRLGFPNSYFYVLASSILLKHNMGCFFPSNWSLKAAFVKGQLILKGRLWSITKASAALW